jgi:hypothetical protein
MGSFYSKQNLSIVLCHGTKSHSSFQSNFYYSIDIDPSSRPDKVGDLRVEYRNIHDSSLNELVFHFCPTHVFRSSAIAHWLRKVKPGGRVIFKGQSYHNSINVSNTVKKKWIKFGDIIDLHIRHSKIPYAYKSLSDNVILVRKL